MLTLQELLDKVCKSLAALCITCDRDESLPICLLHQSPLIRRCKAPGRLDSDVAAIVHRPEECSVPDSSTPEFLGYESEAVFDFVFLRVC